jgi:hypothetical protein
VRGDLAPGKTKAQGAGGGAAQAEARSAEYAGALRGNFISRTAHYESLTMNGTGFNGSAPQGPRTSSSRRSSPRGCRPRGAGRGRAPRPPPGRRPRSSFRGSPRGGRAPPPPPPPSRRKGWLSALRAHTNAHTKWIFIGCLTAPGVPPPACAPLPSSAPAEYGRGLHTLG